MLFVAFAAIIHGICQSASGAGMRKRRRSECDKERIANFVNSSPAVIKAKGLASLTDEQKKKRHDEQKKVPSQSARPCRVCSRPLLVHDCTRALSL